MICKVCGHENDGGNFCEKCGAKLDVVVERDSVSQLDEVSAANNTEVNTAAAASPAEFRSVQNETASGESSHHVFAAAQPNSQTPAGGVVGGDPTKPNPYLESAKQNSKIYFSYFLKGLRNPLAVTQKTGKEQLLNGIISIAIFVLLISLMFYSSLGSDLRGFFSNSPFVDFMLKPMFWLTIFLLLVVVFTFGAVKLSTNPNAHFKEIVARFGTLMIPFIAISVIAFLLILMKVGIGGALLTITLIGVIFTIPALITMSYKREVGGLDTLYAILLIYAAIYLTMIIAGDSFGNSMKSMLGPERFMNF